jgi:hypothetical protein
MVPEKELGKEDTASAVVRRGSLSINQSSASITIHQIQNSAC